MQGKRIVIIRSNPVRPDSRVEKEAYTLVRAGYRVTILCWDRDSDHPALEEQITVADETIPAVRIGCKASFGAGMKSLRPYLAFQFAMRKWLKQNRKQIDLIHACDFDTAFFSFGIAGKYGIRFIFDIFDYLFSGSETVFGRIIRHLQNRMINGADGTIICTEERRRQIAGTRPRRLAVIHNTPMHCQIRAGAKREIPDNGKLRVAYVGILQDYRLLREIGDYFAKHPEYEWHVGGFGKYENYFAELSEKHENIRFYGRLAYGETLALEQACDIMLCVYDPEIDNHKFAAPNKFYESLMLGKPVIMAKGTGMSSVVSENRIGELIDFSEEGFGEGLKKLADRRNEWPEIAERMKKIYETDYSWEQMARRLIQLYASVLDGAE